jgi:hypothetical protein
MFICPDGKVKRCYEKEMGKTIYYEPEWRHCCLDCKAVEDFMEFI